jgi:hypothetical protein
MPFNKWSNLWIDAHSLGNRQRVWTAVDRSHARSRRLLSSSAAFIAGIMAVSTLLPIVVSPPNAKAQA